MTVPYLEDHALMQRIARGDAGAFRELSNLHLKAIVTFATRLLRDSAEAEEVAQEVFLRAWQNAGRYEPKAKASTWLFTITRNLAVDRMRTRKRRGDEFALDDQRDEAPTSVEPGHLLQEKQQALLLKDALAALPERQRTALCLCHEQGLSGSEIAAVLQCSPDAVESLLGRGRRTLRELMNPTASEMEEGDFPHV